MHGRSVVSREPTPRRGGRASTADRMGREMLDAGRQALARGAWEKARDLFQTQIEKRESAEALEGLGWALWWLDDPGASLDLRERAFRELRRRGDRRAAARVATSLGVDSFDVRGEAVGAGWLERARHLLEGDDVSAERGWLELWTGHIARLLRDDLDAARHHATAAATIGRSLGVTELELLAEALKGLILISERKVEEGMRRLDEATAAALSGDIVDLDAVGAACCFLVYACEQTRDQKRAVEWAKRVEEFCRRWRVRSLFAVCRTQHAAMLVWEGAWREAEEELEESIRVLTASRPASAAQAVGLLGELRRRQGRRDEARSLFARAEGQSLSFVGRSAMLLDDGDPGSASILLERALRRAAPDNWAMRSWALELLSRCHLLLDEPKSAGRAAREMRRMSAAVGTAPLRAMSSAAEGEIAAAAGRLDEARCAFEDAVDLYDAAHMPYEASHQRWRLAEVLAKLGRHALATAERERGAATLQALGTALDVEPNLAAAARPRHAIDTPDLTTRERDVLRLIAQGLGDKQVASRLQISAHTVHRHVSNILARLGLPSRAAAVAHAARTGLL